MKKRKQLKTTIFFDTINFVYLFLIILTGFLIFFTNIKITVTFLDFLVISVTFYAVIVLLNCIIGNSLKDKFTLFSFCTAFFILLLGRYISNLGDEKSYGSFTFTKVSKISYLNEAKGLWYILLALYTIFVSYLYFSKKKKPANPTPVNSQLNIIFVKKWSKFIMYFGGISAFIKLLSKISFVKSNGYLATYLTSSAFYNNPFIDLFDSFYLLGFYGFLACFPSKKEIKWPCLLYLIYTVLSLLTGVRGTLVVGILFFIWYLMKREKVRPKEKIIITKSRIIILGILAIGLFLFLYNFGYARIGKTTDANSVFVKLLSFLSSQGGSGKLVALSLEEKANINNYISDLIILFSPIKNFLINNSLVRLFTSRSLGHSEANLYLTGDLDSVLTFITNKESYLSGAGLGTCYIAELACSGGILGVIVFNILLGFLLNKSDNIQTVDSWAKTVFLLKAFSIIVYLPRHATLQIIPECALLLVYVIAIKILCGSKRKKHVKQVQIISK